MENVYSEEFHIQEPNVFTPPYLKKYNNTRQHIWEPDLGVFGAGVSGGGLLRHQPMPGSCMICSHILSSILSVLCRNGHNNSSCHSASKMVPCSKIGASTKF